MTFEKQEHQQCDCNKHAWNARINYPDNQGFSTGQIKLSVGEPKGFFLLDSEPSQSQMSLIESGQVTIIEVLSHHAHSHLVKNLMPTGALDGVFYRIPIDMTFPHYLEFDVEQ